MKTKNLILLLVLVVTVFYGFYTHWGTSIPKTLAMNPEIENTVILTSFGSKDSNGNWQGEVAPYMRELKDQTEISNKIPLCQLVYKGSIFNQPVLVVVAGEAKVRMTACMENLLQQTDEKIREVILSGIAGFSPMKGAQDPVMIGDVCINSAAFDFDMQHYSADISGLNDPVPVFWSFSDQNILDNVTGSPKLANELFAASQKVSWPEVSSAAAELDIKYHGKYSQPKAWGPGQCLESSDDLFWHDIRLDKRARELGSDWLNVSLGLQTTPDDIIVATAMEAVPAGAVIEHWNKIYKTNISFAYIRAASNFDHVWVNSKGIAQADGENSLQTGLQDGSAQYAYETSGRILLKLLELRND